MHHNLPLMTRFFDSKDKEVTLAATVVTIGKKQFPVPAGYGAWLKSHQETCDNMYTVCKSRTRKDFIACMPNLVKAKAQASSDKSKEHVVFVYMFASWL